jgi:hypothetical protein
VYHLIPAHLISFTGLNDGFSDIVMLPLNDTIGLRIIRQDVYWVNPVFARELIYCNLICGRIIRYDLGDWSPSAQELFKNKGT